MAIVGRAMEKLHLHMQWVDIIPSLIGLCLETVSNQPESGFYSETFGLPLRSFFGIAGHSAGGRKPAT